VPAGWILFTPGQNANFKVQSAAVDDAIGHTDANGSLFFKAEAGKTYNVGFVLTDPDR